MRVVIPWPPAAISPNGSQADYLGTARAAKSYKITCGKECMAQGIRRITADAVHVTVTFHPPTHRAYDLDNALARIKQGLDAVAYAIGVDDARWASMTLQRAGRTDRGKVVVDISTEVEWAVTLPVLGAIS